MSTPTASLDLAYRLGLFLGAVATLAPDALVRVDGAAPVKPEDFDAINADLDGDLHVVVCLAPTHLDEEDWSTGYTPEWEAISRKLDAAAKSVGGRCDDGGIEEDGSGETWSYRIPAEV